MDSKSSNILRVVGDNVKLSHGISMAADIIKGGGLVIFPTSTVYGLAGNAMRSESVKNVFVAKQRPFYKPISVIISEIENLKEVAKSIPKTSISLLKRFWPGGVTFIVEALEMLPPILTAGTGKIGVRVPFSRIAAAFVAACGLPLTATSANISGMPGVSCIENIDKIVLDKVDLVIDAGPLLGGVGSTVVDITSSPFKVLREGTIPKDEIPQ